MSASSAPCEAVATIEMAPEVGAVPMLRTVLRRLLPATDPEEASLYYGAVTEVVINAVRAHQVDEVADPIAVDVCLGERPDLTVTDGGRGLDPGAPTPTADFEGTGQGLRIVRAVCEGVEIDSDEHGTRVRLPFPVDGGAAPPRDHRGAGGERG